ncbi:hypothetical protein IAU60_006478 [Kwoniella sp. DSM 27419]
MSSRPSTYGRPTNLTIRPPSPSFQPPSLTTPNNPTGSTYNLYSPRKAPLPPSPTYSSTSYASTKGSSGVGTAGVEVPPPVPAKSDKRLPGLPPGGSPHRAHTSSGVPGGKGWAATGVYDNKLVSSTLSHLPPLPQLSPTPTASTSSHPFHSNASASHLLSHATNSISPRPSISAASSGVVVFPDGTPLSDHSHVYSHEGLVGRVAENTSPSSPWSLLTVHVLPLFAGSALKTPLEDLNQLCHSHIIATSQRSPPSRIVALLTSDLREFIASGMLTLKAKFETLEEGKVVSRAAEVWSFFWAQVLPYVEGVFLPFTQLRDVPTASGSSYLSPLSSPIPVRHLLLSGFLLHILLPLIPRLIPPITSTVSPTANSHPPPTAQELGRILQMSLVLSTQARYSSFFAASGQQDKDEDVRQNVESLGRAVRWKMEQNEREAEARAGTAGDSPVKASSVGAGGPKRTSLQRGPSLSQTGRYRRRGWRASANLGMGLSQYAAGVGEANVTGAMVGGRTMSRQDSGDPNMIHRWGRPRMEDDDEEEHGGGYPSEMTPSTYAPPHRVRPETSDSLTLPSVPSTMSTTAGGSTLTSGTTIRGESLASYGDTPSASMMVGPGQGLAQGRTEMVYGRPVRRTRAESEGSSVTGADRRDRRV